MSWEKIGEGVTIGPGTTVGQWSRVGHYSRIGSRVTFGPWARTGLGSIIDSGVTLESHEYVPSGTRRTSRGVRRLVVSEGDQRLFDLYDQMEQCVHGGVFPNSVYRSMVDMQTMIGRQVLTMLPAWLERQRDGRRAWWLMGMIRDVTDRERLTPPSSPRLREPGTR